MLQTTDTAATDSDFNAAVESSKLAALYNFAYGLSHEINNPLANIATRAQTLLLDEKNPERRGAKGRPEEQETQLDAAEPKEEDAAPFSRAWSASRWQR